MDTIADLDPLAETLFSRNRRAVLGLLYGHPEEQFYLRQVVRLSSGGVGAIQRELRLLTDAGLVRRSVRGNQVNFQANSDCPIFEELKAILAKTIGVADTLRTALAPLADRISFAFVYGSLARGQQRSQSDVDLMVVGEVDFGEIVASLADTQAQLRREINPTVYSVAEFSAKIKAGHHFLNAVLKREKVFLIGDDRELKRLAEKRVARRTRNKRRKSPIS
jgi:predicted nucleotidyltransferase